MYRGYRFSSNGYVDSGTGWYEDDTWTIVYDNPSGNKNRMTSTFTADTWTYVWHNSVRGAPWEQSSGGSSGGRLFFPSGRHEQPADSRVPVQKGFGGSLHGKNFTPDGSYMWVGGPPDLQIS